ncbi:hypothetical protein XYCOK13_22260 [Xylanibacillus composti]|uniref:Uncharacterized protein n=1 Tax=Xylanibacillus composti TaxID=1572762 RepID=A0A8J4H4K3_9BACL|nr:hypothetical protein XYCOK13_22260 [Xylanibacillus composti]
MLHASVTSQGPGKLDYVLLDPHWMSHMGIEPEETVWIVADDPRCTWTASVVPGKEGKGQLAVYGEHAARITNRSRLSVYAFHSGPSADLGGTEWVCQEPEVVIELADGNRINRVLIRIGADAEENPAKGEWACEQSI